MSLLSKKTLTREQRIQAKNQATIARRLIARDTGRHIEGAKAFLADLLEAVKTGATADIWKVRDATRRNDFRVALTALADLSDKLTTINNQNAAEVDQEDAEAKAKADAEQAAKDAEKAVFEARRAEYERMKELEREFGR